MGTLETVMNMKQQGISEDQIIQSLKSQGISPKEISDALTQSQIKYAVGQGESNDDMHPSMMGRSLSEAGVPQNNPPQQEEIYQPQASYSPQQSTQYYPQEQTQEEYYPQQGNYENSYSESGVENMIEISEQVFYEKMRPLQKQIEELIELKSLIKTKIENLEERLRRMEKVFDQMQISIIEKVGNYGKGLETLKKELEMVEDSFSKVVDKATDKTKTKRK